MGIGFSHAHNLGTTIISYQNPELYTVCYSPTQMNINHRNNSSQKGFNTHIGTSDTSKNTSSSIFTCGGIRKKAAKARDEVADALSNTCPCGSNRRTFSSEMTERSSKTSNNNFLMNARPCSVNGQVYQHEMIPSPSLSLSQENDSPSPLFKTMSNSSDFFTNRRPRALSDSHAHLGETRRVENFNKKNVFINVVSPSPTTTPRGVEKNHDELVDTKRHFSPLQSEKNKQQHCWLEQDVNENTFTFYVDSDEVKDVYLNYERIRSASM